jgi:nicotinate-nucleotide adenylyltransferase
VNAGIFGGTFDPPHAGHLIVAQDAAVALGLDRVLFIPAAQPPHKRGLVATPASVRARMTELAIQDDPRFRLDTIELERTGPSYSVDTLRDLSRRFPDTDWTFLMGADQYAEFSTWREPDSIRRLARLAVLTRSGTDGGAGADGAGVTAGPRTEPLADGTLAVSVTRIDVSSTAIRARVAAGLPIRYLVPPAVEAFIYEQRLYARNGPGVAG